MKVAAILKQLSSFFLPLTVLVLIPIWIEQDLSKVTMGTGLLGLPFLLAGFALMLTSIRQFIYHGKGTLAPWFPTKRLIVTGCYRFVRNPMILGVILILLGESIFVWSFTITIWMIAFFMINQLFFWIYEEPNLSSKFGNEYVGYKKSVPRWIPDFKRMYHYFRTKKGRVVK